MISETMHLMCYLNEKGERVYTLKVFLLSLSLTSLTDSLTDVTNVSQKADPNGTPTVSAHPARFSPDDKFSKERIACKKRFHILPTQVRGLF